MNPLQVLVVEDEPLAAEGLSAYIREVPSLCLLSCCPDALQAQQWLQRHPVDLMFLDIHMPRLNGLDFLRTLSHPPMVVLTTAYPQYALQGFELDVLDYLVKPYPFERFLKAVNKALERQVAPVAEKDHFFLRTEGRYERLLYTDILWVESMENYVVVHTAAHKHMALMPLKAMQEQLPVGMFLRTHKCYLVNKAHVRAIDGNMLCLGKGQVPISRALRAQVLEELLG